MLSKLKKFVRNCQHPFCDIITKIKTCELTYEARIRDNEIHDKEKNLQELLLFLKELSPKTFS